MLHLYRELFHLPKAIIFIRQFIYPYPPGSMKPSIPLLVFAALIGGNVQAQNIGINVNGAAPAASALLDIDASALPANNKRGLLIPRIALTSRTVAAPVVAPVASLVVYNTATAGAAPNNVTPGFYYWDGTSEWLRMFSGNDAWSTVGNSGTVAGTNFLGTTDARDFVVKTGGSAAANERMRVLSTGEVVVNNSTPITGDVFSAYGTNAVSAYSSGAGGAGFYTETSGNASWGMLSLATATGNTTSVGVQGESSANNGTGVAGFATSTAGGSVQPVGVYGSANNATGFGMQGSNSNATGTAMILTGNNAAGTYLTGGSGAAINGSGIGTFTYGRTASNGTGLLGVGNNQAAFGTLVDGSGIAGTGLYFGVYAVGNNNSNTANVRAGGYFESGTSRLSYSYVAAYDGGLPRKITGNGTMNTIVKDPAGKLVLLSAPEAPENLFQDYGTGTLVNGRAHVALDPVFSMNILVNAAHPLRAFVQLEGDCAGVYVTNKSAEGFDVVELQGGTSNVDFTWTVTGNRANVTLPDGTEWKFAEERFPKGPVPQEKIMHHKVDLPENSGPNTVIGSGLGRKHK